MIRFHIDRLVVSNKKTEWEHLSGVASQGGALSSTSPSWLSTTKGCCSHSTTTLVAKGMILVFRENARHSQRQPLA